MEAQSIVTVSEPNEREQPFVLVVDDDPMGLRILQEALEGLDCRMLVARSGARALEILSTVQPPLILLDVMMEGMDGFETCRRIKSEPTTQDSVVIFLSAKTDLASRLEGLSCGGIDYIAKPYSAQEVSSKVQTHLDTVRLRKQLEARNGELDLSNKKQNQLLGMAAHDLRTPLTAIIVAAKTLKSRKLNPQQQLELLSIVESSSHHMQGLIEELLDMSALQSSEVSVRPTQGCLNELVSERLCLHSYVAQSKDIKLETQLGDLPEMSLDHQKMSQVIDNLVTNAIKYSWPNGQVDIITRIDGEQAILEVIDHGVGIAKDDLSMVFEPFAKVGSRPTRGESSHGLGLAIARNIVRGHGGQISVESSPGEGSKFAVSLKI